MIGENVSTRRMLLLTALLAVFGLVLSACGGDSESTATTVDDSATAVADDHDDEETDHEDEDDHDEEFTFGTPGDPADADRIIGVDANDDLTFDPADIQVSAGETITFVVTNTGAVPHDFTIGDEATQDAHEEEMAEMIASGEMGEHTDPNAVVLEAGETKELTWTFTETGTVLIGCHQPGHYAGGMKGAVEVGA